MVRMTMLAVAEVPAFKDHKDRKEMLGRKDQQAFKDQLAQELQAQVDRKETQAQQVLQELAAV